MITKELVEKISTAVQEYLFTLGMKLYELYGTTTSVATIFSIALLKEALRLVCFTYDLDEPTEEELTQLKDVVVAKITDLRQVRIESN